MQSKIKANKLSAAFLIWLAVASPMPEPDFGLCFGKSDWPVRKLNDLLPHPCHVPITKDVLSECDFKPLDGV